MNWMQADTIIAMQVHGCFTRDLLFPVIRQVEAAEFHFPTPSGIIVQVKGTKLPAPLRRMLVEKTIERLVARN